MNVCMSQRNLLNLSIDLILFRTQNKAHVLPVYYGSVFRGILSFGKFRFCGSPHLISFDVLVGNTDNRLRSTQLLLLIPLVIFLEHEWRKYCHTVIAHRI